VRLVLSPTLAIEMRHVANSGSRLIFAYASALHLAWAALLLLSPHDMRTAALATFIHTIGVGPAAALFLLIGGTALYASVRAPRGWLGLALVFPQQVVLLLTAAMALEHALRGSYGDGVLRPPEFILADQLPVILTALIHTAALTITYGPRRGGRSWRE
jgi:hypothetical protein